MDIKFLIPPLTVLPIIWSLSATAQSGDICGKRFTSSEQLRTEILRQPGTTRQPNDQNIDVLIEKGGLTIWNFYRSPHPAAPTVVCLKLVQRSNGGWNRLTRIICGADKPTCDDLKVSYDELTKSMRRAIEDEQRKVRQRS